MASSRIHQNIRGEKYFVFFASVGTEDGKTVTIFTPLSRLPGEIVLHVSLENFPKGVDSLDLSIFTRQDEEVWTGIYQHFKGGKYLFFFISVSVEDGTKIAVYSPLYGEFAGKIVHRTIENFTEEVDRPEFDYRGPRFTAVEVF